MNYYIDLDNTMYETSRLTDDMLSTLAKDISEEKKLNFDEIKAELKANFNREHIYNIYKLARFFGNKYGMDSEKLVINIENVIANGEKYVFPDVVPYLKSIKNNENSLHILTYVAQEDLEYQLAKLRGSKLLEYFDNIIVTSSKKWLLDLKYEEGFFIDDSPKDLEGLYSKKPKKLIRMRREVNKYSKVDLALEGLEEVKSFDEIK